MKVLHLLQSRKFSGAENVVCQIIDMFRYDPEIQMIYCSPDGQIRDALIERKIRYVPIKKLSVFEIRRIIKIVKPDIVHAHDMRASLIAALACGKIPLVSHIHNNAYDSRGLSIKSIAYYAAALKAKRIIWVSKSAYEGYYFHNNFKRKSLILYNIINLESLYQKMSLDKNEYSYDVIYVGRLTYPKNPQRLINVIRILLQKKPYCKIAIVGNGDLETETVSLARQFNIDNNIDFLGFQSNPLKILHDSKVMVMTSRWEGTPMCVLEAMALGVPIVSTPTDGIKSLIKNGVNGYLFSDDSDLVSGLFKILNNNELRSKMSSNQISLSVSYNNTSRYCNKLRSIYLKIL